MPPSVESALKKAKRPSSTERRVFVRRIMDQVHKNHPHCTKKDLNIIADRIVNTYPESFKDIYDGQVIGSGYASLAKQLADRRDNLNRPNNVNNLKRACSQADTSTKAKKKPTDSYGCIAWQPPTSEAKRNLDEIAKHTQYMQELVVKKEEEWDDKLFESAMKATYPLQREIINSGVSVHDVMKKWPVLKYPKGLFMHFRLLVGFDVHEQIRNSMGLKAPKILKFMENISTRKRLNLQPILQSTISKMEADGTKIALCPGVILMIMEYFKEKSTVLFIRSSVSVFIVC